MDAKQLQNGAETLKIEGNSKSHQYINELEKEKNNFKKIYYLWVSRFYILTATVSMLFLVAASLSLFRLAPMVTVTPFLFISQGETANIVRNEQIGNDMVSKDQLLEMYIKQYIVLRNTFISDALEMRTRWMGGGMVNYYSSPEVYDQFARQAKVMWERYFKQSMMREVEIISITRQGGARSKVWKVDFKTNDFYNEFGKTQAQKEATLRIRYWTSSITAHFIPERAFMAQRLLNPLGFTVTRYSQTEVEVF